MMIRRTLRRVTARMGEQLTDLLPQRIARFIFLAVFQLVSLSGSVVEQHCAIQWTENKEHSS